MNIKKAFIIILLLSSSIFANSINVAIAANVSYAIDDLIKEFRKIHPNIEVKTTLGGSGKLTAQIQNGAPYDIFMSANMAYPNALYKSKVAITKPVVYAKGSLALLSKTKRDFSKGLEILKDDSIKRIAIANPKTAPYGKASFEALKNAKIFDEVKSKFIFGESIAPTVAYTLSVADIGMIAKSSLYSPKLKRFKEEENWIEVNPKLYTPIKQGIVILKNAKDNKAAKAFYDFILSDNAKKIFKNYGYLVD